VIEDRVQSREGVFFGLLFSREGIGLISPTWKTTEERPKLMMRGGVIVEADVLLKSLLRTASRNLSPVRGGTSRLRGEEGSLAVIKGKKGRKAGAESKTFVGGEENRWGDWTLTDGRDLSFFDGGGKEGELSLPWTPTEKYYFS